jgi:hypothetical protein
MVVLGSTSLDGWPFLPNLEVVTHLQVDLSIIINKLKNKKEYMS